jgi:membrane-associated phospholipid phosphatase
MEDAMRATILCRAAPIAVIGAGLIGCASALLAQEVAAPRAEGWFVKAYGEIDVPAPPRDAQTELNELKAIVAKRTADDAARFHWWAAGGPVYRWNEILVDALLDDFVTLPLAARHLALFHAALDDVVAVAGHHRKSAARPGPVVTDTLVKATIQDPAGPSFPSDYAAAATAAAEVLGYIFPARASTFAAKAEEAMQVRLLAGVEYPSDAAAGRAIGQKIAAQAIARGKSDLSDAKWTGSVPEGPGRWKGSNPIAPLAGTWTPWVLARQDEFRPPAPPPFDSDAVKAALGELKAFARTPKSNHRAVYWEVYGGARAHALWNEVARMKLLEYGKALPPAAAARILAALNIAFLDAAIACWDAKYTYWYIRPTQLDPELKSVFPPPNHPSYPAAHGCLSTAAATVLAAVFSRDSERLLAQGKEAAEARIWAGIHYRFDIEAGQTIGRKVAEKVLERAFLKRTQ